MEITNIRLITLTGATSVGGDCDDPSDRANCTMILKAALKESDDIDDANLTPEQARPRFKALRAKVAAVAPLGATSAADVGKVIDQIEREIKANHLPERSTSGRSVDVLSQIASGELDLENAKRRGINVY